MTSGLLGEQYVGLEPGGDSVMLKNNSVAPRITIVWNMLYTTANDVCPSMCVMR